jgi:hypothetical protein
MQVQSANTDLIKAICAEHPAYFRLPADLFA